MSSLITKSVPQTIISLALPMLAGTFALQVYNLTTTWLVSKLGTDPLAAMSFTFPVVMLLGFMLMSIGTGTMTVVAYSLGGGNHAKAARVTSHAVLLMLLFSAILCAIGFLIGVHFWGLTGLFAAQLICDIAAAICGVIITNYVLDKAEKATIRPPEIRACHPMAEQRRRDYPEMNQ